MLTPRPVLDDADAVTRMRALAARLRSLDCPRSQIPPALLAEDRLLREYARRRVAQETARVDQAAAGLLDALDATR